MDLNAPEATLRIGGRPLPVVGPVRMYVCGITTYDATHLGHARATRLVLHLLALD